MTRIRSPKLRPNERYTGSVECPSLWRASKADGSLNPAMEIRVLAPHPDGGFLYEWLHQGHAERRCAKQLGHAPDENLRRIFRPVEPKTEEDEMDEQRDDEERITADLLGTTDAMIWAREFMALFGDRLEEIDEELLIGWFANAMQAKETAIEKAARENSDDAAEEEPHRFTTDSLHELAFLVGGAATGPCLRNAPGLVMPAEEITEGINRILSEKNLPPWESESQGDDSARVTLQEGIASGQG